MFVWKVLDFLLASLPLQNRRILCFHSPISPTTTASNSTSFCGSAVHGVFEKCQTRQVNVTILAGILVWAGIHGNLGIDSATRRSPSDARRL